MANNYRELFKSPGFVRVVSTQLLARFPFGMMSLGLVMHIQHVYSSYAIAGFALGAETIGAAVSGPLLGRRMGVVGVRKVILPFSILSALAIFGIAFININPLVTIALAAVVGLTSPPIQSAARTVYPTLVKKKLLSSVYALDATSQELIWVIGPVLATVLAAQINTAVPVIVMGALQIIGAWLFVANKEVANIVIPKSNRKIGGVLKNKIVFANLILGMLLIGSFSGVEVGTVAVLGKELAGPVIALFSVGSIIGGLVLGNRNKGKWALTRFLALICFGYLLVATGRAEIMDAVPAGGLGGTFGGNPLSCAAAVAVLEAVRRGMQMPLADGLRLESSLFGILAASEDMHEGLKAFLEKRPAQYRARGVIQIFSAHNDHGAS